MSSPGSPATAQIQRALKRRARAYPRGMPTRILKEVSDEASDTSGAAVRCSSESGRPLAVNAEPVHGALVHAASVLFLCNDATPAVVALFEAAVTKGMSCTLDQVALVSCKSDVEVAQALSTATAPIVVVCGSTIAAMMEITNSKLLGWWKLKADTSSPFIRCTADLKEVLADRVKKRMFWEDLQEVVRRLPPSEHEKVDE